MCVCVFGKHIVWMYQQVVKVRLPLNTPWRHMWDMEAHIHSFLTSGASCRWVAHFASHPIVSMDPVTRWFVGPPQSVSTVCRKVNSLVLAMNRTKSPPLPEVQLHFRFNFLNLYISLIRFRKRCSTCLPVAVDLILGSDFVPSPPTEARRANICHFCFCSHLNLKLQHLITHWIIYAFQWLPLINLFSLPVLNNSNSNYHEHSTQYHFVTSICWWLKAALSVFTSIKYKGKQQSMQILFNKLMC